MGQNAVNVPPSKFFNEIKLVGAELSLSKILRSKGQGLRSPHDQFWGHKSIQIYQAATFVNKIKLIGGLLSSSETLRAKGQSH